MRESPLTGHLEGIGADLTEASFVVIDVPKRLFGRVAAYLESRATMRRKIVELKDRNLILSARAQRMEALMAENMRYKALLNSAVAEDTTMTVARIVAVSPDVNRHLLTLNRGDADGVMIGDPCSQCRWCYGSSDAGGAVGESSAFSDRRSTWATGT
jgi:rod shape-determining protein MreC